MAVKKASLQKKLKKGSSKPPVKPLGASSKKKASVKASPKATAKTSGAKSAKPVSKLASLKGLLMGQKKNSSKTAAKDSEKKKSVVGAGPSKQTKPQATQRKESKSSMTQSSQGNNKAGSKKVELKVKLTSSSSKKAAGAISAASKKETAAEMLCREVACDGLPTTGGYCRLHYIKNWKKIKRKEVILRDKRINQYIEELVQKYPDKYLDAIRQDLASDKDFAKVIHDLDLDESVEEFDMESESAEGIIDNIRREFEDETETF